MTYKVISEIYKRHYDRTIKTCWIADIKRQLGLTTRKAYNRGKGPVKYPCPSVEIGVRIKRIIEGKVK